MAHVPSAFHTDPVGSPEVDVIREMWDAFQAGGLLATLDYAAPDAKWFPYSAEGRSFETTAEYREYVEAMPDRDEILEASLSEITQEGHWVVVSGRLRMRRPGALRDTTMHWVHRVEGGLITYTASYPNREKALAAARSMG